MPGIRLPEEILNLSNVLVVGLTVSPNRLVHIRRNRLVYLNQEANTDYVDIRAVQAEVINARRLFDSKGWPKIDVTRRSIEETAAAIISLHVQRIEDLV